MPDTRLSRLKKLPEIALRPIPVSVYDPILARVSRMIARKHPGLFKRLGAYAHKTFLIEFSNLPFVMVLRPDPDKVEMKAYRTSNGLTWDAKISGSFLHLFRLLDGRLDGDAIFFSRDLKVEGDTEAIVRLRNALDDVEGSIASDVADFFGPPGRIGLTLLRRIEV